VKSTASDRQLWRAENFDKALVDHFAKEFSKRKFKIDIKNKCKGTRPCGYGPLRSSRRFLSAQCICPHSISNLSWIDIDVRSFPENEMSLRKLV